MDLLSDIINPVASALGAVKSALVPSSSAESGVSSAGSEYNLYSGAPLVSGGGTASNQGVSLGTLLLIGAAGLGGFYLWKHFIKK